MRRPLLLALALVAALFTSACDSPTEPRCEPGSAAAAPAAAACGVNDDAI